MHGLACTVFQAADQDVASELMALHGVEVLCDSWHWACSVQQTASKCLFEPVRHVQEHQRSASMATDRQQPAALEQSLLIRAAGSLLGLPFSATHTALVLMKRAAAGSVQPSKVIDPVLPAQCALCAASLVCSALCQHRHLCRT